MHVLAHDMLAKARIVNEDDDYKMDVLEDLEDVSSPSPRARLALPVSLHTDAARRCSTRR